MNKEKIFYVVSRWKFQKIFDDSAKFDIGFLK